MPEHTPGPWRILEVVPSEHARWNVAPEGHSIVESQTDTERHICINSTTAHMRDLWGGAEGGQVAEVHWPSERRNQALANARLLAAAPALLAAVEAAKLALDTAPERGLLTDEEVEAYDLIEAALALVRVEVAHDEA